MKTDYYIVEVRFPFKSEAKSVEAAAEDAIKQFKAQYGFRPDKWNLRVFEFSSKAGKIGAVSETFFSPSGAVHKELTANHD